MNGDLCWVGEQFRRVPSPWFDSRSRPPYEFWPFCRTGIEASDPAASRTTGARLARARGMVIKTVDRPFTDLDVDISNRPGEADPVDVVEAFEDADSSPIRGILLAIVLCTPFWIAVYWLLF